MFTDAPLPQPESPRFAVRPLESASPTRRRTLLRRVPLRAASYALVVVLVGLIAGLVWKLVTEPPAYTVGEDGSAAITDRGLGRFFGADAAFVVVGLIAGIALGTLAWWWLRDLGWPVAVIGAVGAATSAFIAWRFGMAIGFNHFAERIAAAQPGDTVPIDLALHTPTAWVVWPFAALTPVLLYSALGHEDAALGYEDPDFPHQDASPGYRAEPADSAESARDGGELTTNESGKVRGRQLDL